MESRNIIGRDSEMAELQRCLDSDRSELVIVYGRRRVGKTFLVDQFFHETYDFTFVGGHKLSQRIQLRNFAKALKKAMKERTMRKAASKREESQASLSYPEREQAQPKVKFDDWFDAFDTLEEYLESLPSARFR